MKRILDWVTTIPFLVVLGLLILGFDPLVRVARLFGRHAMNRVLAVMEHGIIAAFRICNVRVEVERSPLLRKDRGYLFVGNHQSNFDVPLLGAVAAAHHPRFVAKRDLARWIPGVSFPLRHGGHALVDPQKPRETLRAIAALAAEAQASGDSVVIFPEGRRSRDGTLLDFQVAGTATILNSAPDLAVVPTIIEGAAELMEHGLFPTPFGTVVRLRFGDPIERTPGEDPRELLERVRSEIAATLGVWRAGNEVAAG